MARRDLVERNSEGGIKIKSTGKGKLPWVQVPMEPIAAQIIPWRPNMFFCECCARYGPYRAFEMKRKRMICKECIQNGKYDKAQAIWDRAACDNSDESIRRGIQKAKDSGDHGRGNNVGESGSAGGGRKVAEAKQDSAVSPVKQEGSDD